MKHFTITLLLLFFTLCSTATHAAVNLITLADFATPVVLDFESVPVGPISGTASLFTDVGISSIIPTPQGTDTDLYDARPNSSRALGANSRGLLIADPGTAGVADTNDWRINFDASQTRFGFATHDTNTLPLMTLLFEGAQVGSFSPAPPDSDLFQVYFESTVAFNAIEISQPGTASGFGFMLDNFTLEAQGVPEPTTFVFAALGLIGLVTSRKKRA